MKLWIRIDVAIRSDPNVAELASRLRIDRAAAVGHCTLVWAAIAEHRPSGDLSGISIPALEDWACWEPRKGRPAGAFGAVFLKLFSSDAAASGWRDRQGKLVERAEKDRARKGHGKAQDIRGNSAATERDATERNGEHLKSDAKIETISPVEAGEPPASLIAQLPAEARELLTRFYELPAMTPKQRERYRGVAMQLVDALDPKHPGPKIRGGQRVKARSPEHMADVCRAVMRDPPMNRDMAIVFVLTKLTDPPKGPSVTEMLQRNAAAERQIEEQYHAAATQAGATWAKDYPESYAPILAQVDAKYRGKSGTIINMARSAELTQACSQAAGFPRFEEWLSNREIARIRAHA